GFNNDQKLAAIITPAANPNMELSTFLLMLLKKNTMDAPNAVISHVNNVAIKASKAGLYCNKLSYFIPKNN
ncbi:MAG TPA: hypothetical protein PK976_04600, partial [Bacteroidales bacterium]|nr:hypothetical protein [Bacteroidales bacterium]